MSNTTNTIISFVFAAAVVTFVLMAGANSAARCSADTYGPLPSVCTWQHN